MPQDEKEIVVASNADVFTGPVGTAFPDEPAETVDPAFTQLGLISEDGAKFSRSISIQGIKAMQRKLEVRRIVESEEVLASWAMEQWNGPNWALAFGGGEFIESKPGIFSYDFPTGDDALQEFALLLRWRDGEKNYQLGIDRGNVTEGVEVGLKRAEAALLPISFKALSGEGEDTVGVSFVTDDAAFEPVGS